MRLIYTTCKNATEAKRIASALLKRRFIACANYFPIRSMYRWKGKIQDGREIVLLLKTPKPFRKIKDEVERLHSYKVPCIAEISVRNLNTKYHQWIIGEMK